MLYYTLYIILAFADSSWPVETSLPCHLHTLLQKTGTCAASAFLCLTDCVYFVSLRATSASNFLQNAPSQEGQIGSRC